jgi:hypothetical protein
MIRCETCGTLFYPGTLFCKECGCFLQDVTNRDGPNYPDREQTIHYLIPSSRRQGELDSTLPIWIGRADPDEQYWPQLDLTNDGGIEMGVSRRHALIRKGGQGLVLIDQFSVNGTWIDQEQLVPDQAYPLSHATQVRFGRLPVQLFLG